ncbi:hypothetical protein V1508DRAFT_435592 [Lipomyces doorenjongii]|uniref:uncharacterized protein n=1 Tax=Lipomyces doorenjongii TaxID=383834 RepID=UPI0034CD5608
MQGFIAQSRDSIENSKAVEHQLAQSNTLKLPEPESRSQGRSFQVPTTEDAIASSRIAIANLIEVPVTSTNFTISTIPKAPGSHHSLMSAYFPANHPLPPDGAAGTMTTEILPSILTSSDDPELTTYPSTRITSSTRSTLSSIASPLSDLGQMSLVYILCKNESKGPNLQHGFKTKYKQVIVPQTHWFIAPERCYVANATRLLLRKKARKISRGSPTPIMETRTAVTDANGSNHYREYSRKYFFQKLTEEPAPNPNMEQ